MQEFTYAGLTIYYEKLPDDGIPIGFGMQADGVLVLVCRSPEEAEGDLLRLLEVSVCEDCHALQWFNAHVVACVVCGGELDWVEVGRDTVRSEQ